MKKRGISPLVASVLLIAFVILLFVLISSWTRRAAIEPAIQTGEEKAASALECAELNLRIVKACDAGTTLTVDIDNIGTESVSKVRVKTTDTNGNIDIDEQLLSPVLDPLGRRTLIDNGDGIGNDFTRVEVYPEIPTGICQGQATSTTTILTTCT